MVERRRLGRRREAVRARAGVAVKRALLTGGTGRVGRVVAARLRDEGFRVFAAGRADGDLRVPEEARLLVERAVGELGGLDLLVYAAADGFSPKPFAEVTSEDWDAAMDVAAKGAFFTAQAAAPHLRETRGTILLVEDVAGYEPWPLFSAHSAAKAAEAMLTRVLARALAPEVRVCGIAPGTLTVEPGREAAREAETLLGRVGAPEDLADAVLYLAGAAFATGCSLVLDGGRLLKTDRP